MATPATPTCVRIRPGNSYDGKQGLTYFAGISAESAGSQGICMHSLTIPPGGRARPHLHENHETVIFVLSGRAEMLYGHGLRDKMEVQAGDFLYTPAGMPHQPYNPSESEPCVAVLARTDANEQESVVVLG